MDLLTAIKRRGGFSTTAYDDDINSLIAQARADLVDSGVDEDVAASTTDNRVLEAVITFVLARCWWVDESEAARYERSYQLQAQKLSAVEGA